MKVPFDLKDRVQILEFEFSISVIVDRVYTINFHGDLREENVKKSLPLLVKFADNEKAREEERIKQRERAKAHRFLFGRKRLRIVK